MAMKFGVLVPQGWRMDLVGIKDPVEAYETMTETAQAAEELGFDSIWLFDHFHTVPVPTQEVTFECWTSTAALARDTKRIRIGQMVTCNSYRNPALLAKMASTVDVLSHGRLDFGIGAGWYEHEYNAYGYEYPEAPIRLRQLREAVQIILKMWSDEEASFEGTYYQIRGAINQPKGVQKPHIPLLIGGGGEKVTLKLVAQYGDACNVGNMEPEAIARKFDIIRQHCESVGRDYSTIRRTVMLNCAIGETDEQALEIAKAANLDRNTGGAEYLRTRALVGTPDAIRQRLAEYEQAGAQEMILFVPQKGRMEALKRLAKDVIGK
ncbi:F420-dependent oxidoreductase-like protein [Thermosporothrix hazakensis]|uniref:F420-dependent oxidoreductase-like protein n=1 Tax=Thermosporothrix hazakensis TaxID=644383 RepID=A0A326U901_THEHA|nr:LLM class F420-dependent oxidoreductase [Thermosporothrix hazakensis]PZW32666.1 F420-dependent oxidoreductase-like protein [Thermosporothrix hazakensis]GCE50018.1 LLM class F420-dependent oxidoreductase [Thermosporothrix hazakensis]